MSAGMVILPDPESCLLLWGLGTVFLFSSGQNPISSQGDLLLFFTILLTSSRWEDIIYLQALL